MRKKNASVPPPLLDLQKWFSAIIVRPLVQLDEYRIPIYDAETIEQIEERVTEGSKLSSAQRLGIYNQQFWFRLLNLLHDHFPTLTRLFGYDGFNRIIAEPYVLKYFPSHWSISLVGRKLPQWIQEEYQDEDKSLVFLCALIDDAYDRLYYLRRKREIRSEDLDHIIEKPLYLQPTVELFELDGDLFSFRSELLKNEPPHWLTEPFPQIDWSRKRWYALSLYSGVVSIQEITSAEFILLKAFQSGATIEMACSLVENEGVEELIGPWFQNWAQKGWLTSSLSIDRN